MNILKEEMQRCFNFFMDYSNHKEGSKGYGLMVDSSDKLERCSIAAVGYKLSAMVIGVENNYITHDEALDICKKTLYTLIHNVDHANGFFAHFVDMETGEREEKTEFSTIDTGLCLNGVILVESYFNDPEITKMADELINRVDFKDMMFIKDDKLTLHMAFNPDKDGAYASNVYEGGYIWHWHIYAEQLMLYFQAAMQDQVSDMEVIDLYNGFKRDQIDDLIYTPNGSLFIYQFSHGWFPFQKYLDCNGVNWFEHSKKATLLNQKHCIEDEYASHNEYIWGLSAGETNKGYRVYGASPKYDRLGNPDTGTIQQYAILSSINFCPEIVIKSINHINDNYPEAFMKYGFSDGLNLEENWICPNYLGIDKGITILMLANYFGNTVWNHFEKSNYVQKAVKRLQMEQL